MKKYTVYKIINNVENKIYVGSTSDPTNRWGTHCRDAACDKNHPMAVYMRKIGIMNFEFIPIKTMECIKEEARREEQIQVDLIEPQRRLNIRRAIIDVEARIVEQREYSKRSYYRNIQVKRAYYNRNRAAIQADLRRRYELKLAKLGKTRKNKSKYNL